MKKINLNQFKSASKRGNSTPVLTLRKNGVVLNKPFFDSLNMNREAFTTVHIEMGEDEGGQLNLRICQEATDDSTVFKPNAKKDEFICHSTGLSNYLKDTYAKDCTRPSVPMKVQTGAVTEGGWMPVITTYWKTLR